MYPPYMIAIAALYMTCVLHGSISSKLHPANAANAGPATAPPTASRFQSPANIIPTISTPPQDGSTSTTTITPRDEIINFLAGLNVSLEVIGTICQRIMSMYALWDTFTDQSEQDHVRRSERRETHRQFYNYRGGSPPPEKALVTEREVVAIVLRIRERRESDLAHPENGRPMGVNKRLELA